MFELWHTLQQLATVLGSLLVEVLALALRWSLAIAWAAWWLWAVDWRKLWPVLGQGAWAPVSLFALLGALVWALWFPSAYSLAGIGLTDREIPNFSWQLLAVAFLLGTAAFCGWVQRLYHWEPAEIVLEPVGGHAMHGHDPHGDAHGASHHGSVDQHTHH
jgi:hypothetical protein